MTGIRRALALLLVTIPFIVPAVADAGRNLYVSNAGGTLSVFDLATDGALLPIGGSPFSGLVSTPAQSASTPDGNYLYVADLGASKVAGFSINGAGTPTPVTGSPFDSGTGPLGAAVTPDGKHLYVGNSNTGGAGSVSGYNIAANGSLTAIGAAVPAGNTPVGIAVTPDGNHLYVANQISGNVSGYSIAANGALSTLGAPVPVGSTTFGLAVGADSDHLYVADDSDHEIVVFAIAANGSLTPQGGVLTPPGTGPAGVAISPDGLHLFAGYSSTDQAAAFGVNANGSLTPIGSPVAAGDNPIGLTVAPGGDRLYLADFNDGAVFGLSIAADGALGALAGSPFDSDPQTYQLSVTPDQPPTASFTAPPAAAGAPAAFDASGSTDPDGTVAHYGWDFGDGTTLPDGGPTPSHTYAGPGSYDVKLTVTDNEGCSTKFLYTGQMAACNGSAVAAQTQAVQVANAPPPAGDTTAPTLQFSGKATEKLAKFVTVALSTDEACAVDLSGAISLKGMGQGAKRGHRLALKGTHLDLVAGVITKAKLKVPKKALKAAADARKRKAKISVIATDLSGNKLVAKTAIRLR